MDTKAHGSKTKGLSVSIRVNPWPNLVFPHPAGVYPRPEVCLFSVLLRLGAGLSRSVPGTEDLFDRMSEERGDLEGEREAGIVPAGFDGVDGLALDAQPLGQLRLRQVVPRTEDAQFVLHWYRLDT